MSPPGHHRLFGQTDSVFARDHSTPCQHLGEKLIQRRLNFFTNFRLAIISVRHDIDVNVPVSGMTETGDRKSMFRACSFSGKLDEIDHAAARDDNVLVQLGQAGRAKRVAEFATQRPKFFAILFRGRHFDGSGISFEPTIPASLSLRLDSFLLSIEINQQMGISRLAQWLCPILHAPLRA